MNMLHKIVADKGDEKSLVVDHGDIFAENCDRYWAAGLPVMPLAKQDKKPVIMSWQSLQGRMPNEAERVSWRLFHRAGNIGLPLGPASGLVAIDIDTDDPTILGILAKVLPPSPWKRIGQKGMVLIYRYDGQPIIRIKHRGADGKMQSLVEMLGAGSQIVLPPSIHPKTKRPYVANKDLLDCLGDIRSLPANIEQILRDALGQAGIQVGSAAYGAVTDYISTGNRDNTLVSMAGLFARDVLKGERTLLEACRQIEVATQQFMQKTYGDNIDPAKGPQKLIEFLIRDVTGPKAKALPKGWDEGLSDEQREAWGLNVLLEARRQYTGNDHGLATRFIDEYGHNLRFVCDENVWIIWNGSIWERDETGRTIQMYLDMASTMLAEAEGMISVNTGNEKDDAKKNRPREKCVSWAKQAGENKRVNSALKLAQTDPRIVVTLAQLDNFPGFLPVANGMVKLTTGELLSAIEAKEMLATRASSYAYTPGAACPSWGAVIARALPGELGSFLQRVLGYSLMGNPCEQRFFVLRGEGADSKSTIARVMAGLLGSLLIRPAGETFLAGDAEITSNAPRADLMAFRGPRVVFAPEPDSRRKLDKELIKRLTGQDGIQARAPYGRSMIEFEMTGTVFLLANHLPACDEADEAVWRRLTLIPFDYTVPEAERDVTLVEKLLANEAEGILAWLIEGAQAYTRDGLQVPEVVRQRTAAWRRTAGRIERFVDENCIREGSAPLNDLHRTYRAVCLSEQIYPLGLDKFSARLKQLGFTIEGAQAGEVVAGLRSRY